MYILDLSKNYVCVIFTKITGRKNMIKKLNYYLEMQIAKQMKSKIIMYMKILGKSKTNLLSANIKKFYFQEL